MNKQILRRLEQLEESMAPPEDKNIREIVIDFVDAADGRPTGKVTRCRYHNRELIFEKEFYVDPAVLRHEKAPGENR
jgi:hypothetical protein